MDGSTVLTIPCPSCGRSTAWYYAVVNNAIVPVNDPPHYCPQPTGWVEGKAA